MKITKRNGESEEFDRTNVESSIRNAGTDEETARTISNIVSEKKCKSTKEIRKVVHRELKKRDTEVARRYDESRSLVARKAIDALRGTARLSKEAMTNLNLRTGDRFTVMHGNNRHSLKVERDNETSILWNEIRLHAEDLETIGITDGRDLIARRNQIV